jgi:hypothetical protein
MADPTRSAIIFKNQALCEERHCVRLAAARDVQSLLHRLVRNHPSNIGLRNSELLSNFRWCEACLEGSANCILFADCQSHGRQFRPLTFSLRRWRFLTTPLLFYRHRNMQLLKFLVAEVLDRSWQIARQDSAGYVVRMLRNFRLGVLLEIASVQPVLEVVPSRRG